MSDTLHGFRSADAAAAGRHSSDVMVNDGRSAVSMTDNEAHRRSDIGGVDNITVQLFLTFRSSTESDCFLRYSLNDP